MASSFAYSSKIAGVTFDNTDGTSRQSLILKLKRGERLKLVDASSTEYPEAIAVYNSSSEQLGFLPKDDAKFIRVLRKDIDSLVCLVFSVGRTEDYKPYGVQIVFAESLEAATDKLESMSSPSTFYTPLSNTYASPSPYSHNSTPPQKKNTVPWGCLIPSIIGLIIGIVLAKIFR